MTLLLAVLYYKFPFLLIDGNRSAVHILYLDIPAFLKCHDYLVDLRFLSLYLHRYRTVPVIPDESGTSTEFSFLTRAPAKTNALYLAIKSNMFANHHMIPIFPSMTYSQYITAKDTASISIIR